MTNKEAIEVLRKIDLCVPTGVIDPSDFYLALALAIKALERDGWLDYDECGTTCLSCPVCGAVWRKKK